jgi:hypothetical protein
MENTNSKKARGFYNSFSLENKELYENIMNISFTSQLEKLTKKELAYLSDLYEKKVKEIKETNKEELEKKDVLTIALSLKLKTVIAKRNINVAKYRYDTNNQLSFSKKNEARNKLKKILSHAYNF